MPSNSSFDYGQVSSLKIEPAFAVQPYLHRVRRGPAVGEEGICADLSRRGTVPSWCPVVHMVGTFAADFRSNAEVLALIRSRIYVYTCACTCTLSQHVFTGLQGEEASRLWIKIAHERKRFRQNVVWQS
eukprot:6134846-Prymnesium_polylepis.1